MTALLDIAALRVEYGGVVALRSVDLQVEEGQTVAVLGANGAGKTSLLRAISGLERPAAGTITYDGQDITGRSPHHAARLGLAHVPDHRGLFPSMTVRENLELAAIGIGRSLTGDDLERVEGLFPILKERAAQVAGTMSGGQQQMLTIARALVQAPRLLMLDEMSMGLAPTIVADLFSVLRELKSDGISILLIEQFVGGALQVADRIVVLEQGEVIVDDVPSNMNADVLGDAYLGGEGSVTKASELAALGPPARVRQALTIDLDPRVARSLQRQADNAGLEVDELVAGLAAFSSTEVDR